MVDGDKPAAAACVIGCQRASDAVVIDSAGDVGRNERLAAAKRLDWSSALLLANPGMAGTSLVAAVFMFRDAPASLSLVVRLHAGVQEPGPGVVTGVVGVGGEFLKVPVLVLMRRRPAPKPAPHLEPCGDEWPLKGAETPAAARGRGGGSALCRISPMSTLTQTQSNPTVASAPGATKPVSEATPAEVRTWLASGQATLVDVREEDEHARERIEGARLAPLSRFDPAQIAAWVSPGQKLVLHCRSGRRSADACRLSTSLGERGMTVLSMAGGIEAWKAAGLPVKTDRRVARLSVMRQVQLTIGLAVLGGSALAWLVHPGFIAIPAFLGAGLTFAGATGTCALAGLIAKLPWNRPGDGKGCAGGTCSV